MAWAWNSVETAIASDKFVALWNQRGKLLEQDIKRKQPSVGFVNIGDYADVTGSGDATAKIQNIVDTCPRGSNLIFDGIFLISQTITVGATRSIEFTFPGQRGILASGAQFPSSYLYKKHSMTTVGLDIQDIGFRMTGGGVIGWTGNTGDGIVLNAHSINLDYVTVANVGGVGFRGNSDVGSNCNRSKLNKALQLGEREPRLLLPRWGGRRKLQLRHDRQPS